MIFHFEPGLGFPLGLQLSSLVENPDQVQNEISLRILLTS
jgi:hypothetical protein